MKPQIKVTRSAVTPSSQRVFRFTRLPIGACLLWLIVSIIVFTPSLSALSLEDILPQLTQQERTELQEKKELVFYTDGAPDFRFLPSIPLSVRVKTYFQGFSPNVGNEALFLIPYLSTGTTPTLLSLYNRLRAVSTLSGIQYRSSKAKGLRVLFSDVYAVKDLKSKTKIPDPLVQIIPPEESFPIHLVDANFGSEYYEASYLSRDNTIVFGLKNLTSLKYIFPVIGTERFRTQLLIIPLDTGLLVYGVAAVEASDMVRSLIHLPSAFYKRMEALKNWFAAGL
ncbi:MAG: hypothetical protein N2442_03605 [Spirochaetes bacterium]|nr:hypothetical protein [Spirochaetota bacterium]